MFFNVEMNGTRMPFAASFIGEFEVWRLADGRMPSMHGIIAQWHCLSSKVLLCQLYGIWLSLKEMVQ